MTMVLIILPPVVLLFYLVAPRWLNWAALSAGIGLRWAGLGLALFGFGLLQCYAAEAAIEAAGDLAQGPQEQVREVVLEKFMDKVDVADR